MQTKVSVKTVKAARIKKGAALIASIDKAESVCIAIEDAFIDTLTGAATILVYVGSSVTKAAVIRCTPDAPVHVIEVEALSE